MDEAAPQNSLQPVASPAVLEELSRVRAISHAFRVIAETLEAQLMASLWKIQKEVPDQTAFYKLIREHTELVPERAWLMAQTWETARHNRPLRELTLDRPSEALACVTAFVEAGMEDKLENLGEDERRVAEIAVMTPRKRAEAIRDLVAKGKAAQAGRHPADAEEIKTLKAEVAGTVRDRDAAAAELEKERQKNSGGQSPERLALNALRDAEKSLAQACENVRPLLEAASDGIREEAQRVGDTARVTIERLLTDIYDSHKQARKDQAGE